MKSKGEGRAKREGERGRRVAGRLPRVCNYSPQMKVQERGLSLWWVLKNA